MPVGPSSVPIAAKSFTSPAPGEQSVLRRVLAAIATDEPMNRNEDGSHAILSSLSARYRCGAGGGPPRESSYAAFVSAFAMFVKIVLTLPPAAVTAATATS